MKQAKIYSILIAMGVALASCGDFFEFNEEPDSWDGVTMSLPLDSAYIMQGDSLPLVADFTPNNPNDTPVYWMLNDTTSGALVGDTLLAVSPGVVHLTAVGGNGRLSKECTIFVIDRWNGERLNISYPSDMVVYGDVTIDGKPWNPQTQTLAAFVRGQLAGIGVARRAHDIDYVELRIWAGGDEYIGDVTFRLFDRAKHDLLTSEVTVPFQGYKTYGTLSALYPLTFTSSRK